MINALSIKVFFGIEGYAALDKNREMWYNTLLLQLTTDDLYSMCTHRQFQILPGFLNSQASLANFTLMFQKTLI